ncbi:hypothetical protein [Pseudotenacibaculum haliotis]|uniref:Arsenate reductase n=1 Tax=Pseudotenacibaculum haliotis TaxID=1862138 RepID=A0ABW5LX79_9FLAO
MIKTEVTKTKNFFENSHRNITINENRKELLSRIADKIVEIYNAHNGHVNINFICTHNSRRSQLGQVWAFFASRYFDLNITPFSGGTEVTAFHRNTVRTLKDVGFTFNVKEFSHQNPVYQVTFEGTDDFILGFSKAFDHSVNKTPYIVITTCDSADENCPFIPEAIHRFHLPYMDPKYADNTPEQDAAYLKTNEEVASEMYFIFEKVKLSL